MTLFKNKYRIESARLKGWDYRSAGHYFVTICTRNREQFFGEVSEGVMRLSPIGEIAAQFWTEIPSHNNRVGLDEFVIMPNHLHGIIEILGMPVETVQETLRAETLRAETLRAETLRATSLRDFKMSAISPKAGSLGTIIRSYKSAVSYWAGNNGMAAFEWQARFYDHIIHDEKSFNQIRQYIFDNPEKWECDRENPTNLYM